MSTTDSTKRIEYLARALKAPRIKDVAQRLSERAREESWTYEEYLDAVLSVEVSQREASGTRLRIRAAGFPMRKSIEDFNFEHQPSLPHSTVAHLGMGSYLAAGSNVVLLGPPGVGKTHLAIGLGIKACGLGYRVLFATATAWITRLSEAQQRGRLQAELLRLRRYGLLIIDEVGYIPFEQEAANLFFQLVSSRYEYSSLILTSNLPFARWGDVFGDQVVASAMVDRIVHHAEVITLKGSSYRLKDSKVSSLIPPVQETTDAQDPTPKGDG